MKISIHICTVPCPEEYYNGVHASYEAEIIEIPNELVPDNVLETIKGQRKNKVITNIAICNF